MVFYTCSGCGESLKKNKVEKHYYSCHGCEYLTCIDCNKDFYGDDYKFHTSCITEHEKYSAKGTEFKPNKGELKQQQWLQNIEAAIAQSTNLTHKARDLLKNLKNYENIPRKRMKFLNFLKNSLRIYDSALGEEVWQVFFSANSKPRSQDSSVIFKENVTTIDYSKNPLNNNTEALCNDSSKIADNNIKNQKHKAECEYEKTSKENSEYHKAGKTENSGDSGAKTCDKLLINNVSRKAKKRKRRPANDSSKAVEKSLKRKKCWTELTGEGNEISEQLHNTGPNAQRKKPKMKKHSKNIEDAAVTVEISDSVKKSKKKPKPDSSEAIEVLKNCGPLTMKRDKEHKRQLVQSTQATAQNGVTCTPPEGEDHGALKVGRKKKRKQN